MSDIFFQIWVFTYSVNVYKYWEGDATMQNMITVPNIMPFSLENVDQLYQALHSLFHKKNENDCHRIVIPHWKQCECRLLGGGVMISVHLISREATNQRDMKLERERERAYPTKPMLLTGRSLDPTKLDLSLACNTQSGQTTVAVALCCCALKRN